MLEVVAAAACDSISSKIDLLASLGEKEQFSIHEEEKLEIYVSFLWASPPEEFSFFEMSVRKKILLIAGLLTVVVFVPYKEQSENAVGFWLATTGSSKVSRDRQARLVNCGANCFWIGRVHIN